MGLLTFVGRIVLVVVNIVFLLVSIILIVFGFLLRFAHETFRPYIKSSLEAIEKNVKDNYGDTDFSTENLDLGKMVSDIALALILLGLVFLALSFVGCCGACCNISTIMLVYAIALIVIALVQLILVILVFGAPSIIKTNVEKQMVKTLDEYQGINGTTAVSLTWNWLMKQFSCCGAKDYTDFDEHANNWWGQGQLTTPAACCKTLPTDDTQLATCAGTKSGTRKTIEEIAENSNYNKGCVDEFWDHLFIKNKVPFLTVFGFCLAGQAVLVFFAILVYKDRGITGGFV